MAVLLLFISSCSKDTNRAVVLVKSTGLKVPVHLYRVDTTGLTSVDSLVKATDKDFKFLVPVSDPTAFILSTKEHQTTFFLGDGDTVTVDYLKEAGIQSEPKQYKSFREFEISKQVLEKKADSLASLFISAQLTDSFAIIREKISSEFNNLLSETRSLSVSFIRNNPESIGIYLALNSTFRKTPVFDYTVTPDIFLFADSVMQKYHPGNRYSSRIHHFVEQFQKKFGQPGKSPVALKQGDILIPIRLPGLNRKPVAINPHKGKIAIVYFWDEGISSRKSTGTVKMLYEKFKSDGLDTYAVSFIESSRTWASLIELDKMWWNNMIDTAAAESVILKTYNIRRLPYFIVIDSNRKVLSHFSTAGALEEWMTLYFKDNK